MNGEKVTGATTFFIEKEIDTGKIIFQEKESITEDDTAGSLYERLMHLGARLVLKTVEAITEGSYPQIAQSQEEVIKQAPKLFKENCEIDWYQPAADVRNFVRGLSPYPAAWTTLNGLTCKLFEVSVLDNTPEFSASENVQPGDFYTDHKKELYFRAADGWVSILDIQLEGKRRMKIADLLRGLRLS
jgi:methionyl-tRNA formyltransferase